jgi:hypothetical protein
MNKVSGCDWLKQKLPRKFSNRCSCAVFFALGRATTHEKIKTPSRGLALRSFLTRIWDPRLETVGFISRYNLSNLTFRSQDSRIFKRIKHRWSKVCSHDVHEKEEPVSVNWWCRWTLGPIQLETCKYNARSWTTKTAWLYNTEGKRDVGRPGNRLKDILKIFCTSERASSTQSLNWRYKKKKEVHCYGTWKITTYPLNTILSRDIQSDTNSEQNEIWLLVKSFKCPYLQNPYGCMYMSKVLWHL